MRPRKPLSFIQQFEVLKNVKAGVPKEMIIQTYDISAATYYRILERKSEILKNITTSETRNRKTSKRSDEKILDDAVIKWFLQMRDRGDPLSMTMIQQKALELNKQLNGPAKFKASNGWFHNFKKRYCIKNIQIKDEITPNDFEAEKTFSDILKEKITAENLLLDNIYNADESGIFWRTSPVSPFTEQNKVKDSTIKERSDHITALFCCNVNGNHRIPPLIIGDSEIHGSLEDFATFDSKGKRLKRIENLNVIYTDQEKSCMDRNLFMLWYTDVFIPHVLEHQKSVGIAGKVLLILDNGPCHPDADELNKIHGNFQVVYLSRNVSPLIQPMEQGLISKTKRLYKINLLKSLLLRVEIPNLGDFFTNLNFHESLILLSKAWYDVDISSFKTAWKPLLCDSFYKTKNSQLTNHSSENEMHSSLNCDEKSSSFPTGIWNQLIRRLPWLEKTQDLFSQWFEMHYNDCGWEPLTDTEILNSVTNSKVIKKEREFVEISCNPDESEIFCAEDTDEVTSSDAFEDIITFDDCIKVETVKTEVEENENAQNIDLEQVTSSDVLQSTTVENLQSETVTSSDAFKGLMMFKKWMQSCEKGSEIHYRYLDELENLIK